MLRQPFAQPGAQMAMDEARKMATAAGMNGVQVSRRWPARYLLSWEKRIAPQATPGD